MRHVRTLMAGTAVTAAALSVVGLTATAQAAPNVTVAKAKTLNVPAGVATAFLSPACPAGNTASLSSSSPALPASVTAVVTGTKIKLVGVWPASPTSYAIKVDCSGGSTVSLTVKVQSAPPENAATGLGAQTQQSLVDQFSGDYNATLSSSTQTHLYNWDAINPETGAIGDTITVKQNCASFPRPDGSSAGIKQLATFATTSDKNFYCDSFANSARPRASTDPPDSPGGVTFVNLAGDAVTWSVPAVNTSAPASLTAQQLNAIFTCTDTNWSQVGGKNQAIAAFLPQSGAGTLTFFLAAIGVTTPGPCVSTASNTLEENEGDNSVLNNPGAIFIYSVGDWIAQKFHSPACTNAGCTGITPPCSPQKGKNEFGCNVDGTGTPQGAEKLGQIDGTKPTTGSGSGTKINPSFDSTFDRTLYEVVPYDPSTSDHIPGATNPVGGVNLEKIFGATGWACTSATAKTDIKNYGFESIGSCGATS
jgi:ABC-type phosphate transport system substrate-binding protein